MGTNWDKQGNYQKYNSDGSTPVMVVGSLAKESLEINRMLAKISEPKQLTIPTYEGSGQAVHPSVVNIPNKFGGYQFWMAFTPYPNTNDDYENPSIVASVDGITWVVPTGLTNPVIPPPPNLENGGHCSDPYLLFDDTKLIVYYMMSETSSDVDDVYRTTSVDGKTWTEPVACSFATDGTLEPVITLAYSPSIVRKSATLWELFYVSGRYMYKAKSSDGIAWSHPKQVAHNMPDASYLWHSSVNFDESGYSCLVATWRTNGTVEDTQLYFGTSRDGLLWIFDTVPCLTKYDSLDWMNRQIYKSSLVQIDDMFRIYFSASTTDGKWYIGYVDAVKNNITRKLNESITMTLTTSGQLVTVPASGIREFGVVGTSSGKCAVAVRTTASVDFSVIIVHYNDTGSTSVYEETVIANGAKSMAGTAFDAKTRCFAVRIKNNTASDITLHTTILNILS